MKTTNLIIGAGISGLTYANFTKEDYLIVEKEDRVGGYCKTTKRNGYVWDYAGHFFHFNTQELKDLFLKNMPEDEILYNQKCTKILYNGSFIDFPFQANIHQLEKQDFIDCLYDLFHKVEKETYENFLDMLYGKFGKSIVEKFLKPYNEKLYATDLKNLDVDAMGRFFPYADKEAIINNMKENTMNSYNSSFLYPKGGAESFIKVLYDNLEKEKVLLNTSVVKINLDTKEATLSNGEKVEYQNLINTMPLNHFLELLGIHKELLEEMSFNKVLVFNLGFDKPSPLCTKEHWLYIPSSECNYYRVGFYNNILRTEKLSMYIEIGYGKDTEITKEEIEKQLSLTLENLKKQGIINEEMKLVDYESIIMSPAYVHINTKTTKKIDALKEEFKEKDVYTIGRYGAWIYNSMEDSMLVAKALAEELNEKRV